MLFYETVVVARTPGGALLWGKNECTCSMHECSHATGMNEDRSHQSVHSLSGGKVRKERIDKQWWSCRGRQRGCLEAKMTRSVAAKVEHSGGVETTCPVKLKTCGFETTKTTSAS